jgi:gluconate 2-dehydrogenase gamma chain
VGSSRLSWKTSSEYMSGIRRRELLKGTGIVLAGSAAARASIIAGHLPWHPNEADPPKRAEPGAWQFFTPEEARTVEAATDRLIPPDPQTPGGKEAGCAVFIDRQLAGPYGSSEGLYSAGPFVKGSKQQGPQSAQTPAVLYRKSLAALERYCHSSSGGAFATLSPEHQDEVLRGLESGTVKLDEVDGKQFFQALLKDTQTGFFSDPIYGGNRDMCAWKMIGFPGARYDYRDWVGRHNERYPHPPVSIGGRAEWTPKRR